MNAADLPWRIIPGVLANRFGPINIIVLVILLNIVFKFSSFGTGMEASVIAYAVSACKYLKHPCLAVVQQFVSRVIVALLCHSPHHSA